MVVEIQLASADGDAAQASDMRESLEELVEATLSDAQDCALDVPDLVHRVLAVRTPSPGSERHGATTAAHALGSTPPRGGTEPHTADDGVPSGVTDDGCGSLGAQGDLHKAEAVATCSSCHSVSPPPPHSHSASPQRPAAARTSFLSASASSFTPVAAATTSHALFHNGGAGVGGVVAAGSATDVVAADPKQASSTVSMRMPTSVSVSASASASASAAASTSASASMASGLSDDLEADEEPSFVEDLLASMFEPSRLRGCGMGGAGRRVEHHSTAATKREVCRYFVAGTCRRADCFYSHDLRDAVCSYWRAGRCLRGDECAYLHELPPEAAAAAAAAPLAAPATATVRGEQKAGSGNARSTADPATGPPSVQPLSATGNELATRIKLERLQVRVRLCVRLHVRLRVHVRVRVVHVGRVVLVPTFGDGCVRPLTPPVWCVLWPAHLLSRTHVHKRLCTSLPACPRLKCHACSRRLALWNAAPAETWTPCCDSVGACRLQHASWHRLSSVVVEEGEATT